MENIQFMNEIQRVFNEKKNKESRQSCPRILPQNEKRGPLPSLFIVFHLFVEKRATQMTEKHAGRSRQCQRLQNNIEVVTHCLAWSLRLRQCKTDKSFSQL